MYYSTVMTLLHTCSLDWTQINIYHSTVIFTHQIVLSHQFSGVFRLWCGCEVTLTSLNQSHPFWKFGRWKSWQLTFALTYLQTDLRIAANAYVQKTMHFKESRTSGSLSMVLCAFLIRSPPTKLYDVTSQNVTNRKSTFTTGENLFAYTL